jgi:hypothetical protein
MAFHGAVRANAQESTFWDIGGDQIQVNIGQIIQTSLNDASATAPSQVQQSRSHKHMPPLFTGRK